MNRLILLVCALCWPFHALAAAPVRVLDGPEVQPMRDGLERVGCAFDNIKALDAASLAGCRVLVLCGTEPPVGESGKPALVALLDAGGNVLGVGRGASCMIDLGLFDAEPYYMAGTTIHMTGFAGYHRLTFGYPCAKPFDNWTAGVPHLLRATQGPLMKLGPKATDILPCGGGYSLAAVQRVGKGIVLLIGADPQGGKEYYAIGKAKLLLGDKMDTDRLLASAVAYLLDPKCNVIPNSGFEEYTELGPKKSHWVASARNGGKTEWAHDGAAEGQTYLKLTCPTKNSAAKAHTFCPIVVERGATYTFALQYKSSTRWQLSWQLLKGSYRTHKAEPGPTVQVQAAAGWTRFETKLEVPADVPYVRPIITIQGPGELCVDAVTLCMN